ncbi:MAG: hypothetical protein QXK37_05455 [Candidatus Woesearchaeota archaeon]
MLDEFLNNSNLVILTVFGLVGFIWAYYLLQDIVRRHRERADFEESYNEILNSDKYKAKGKFEV